MLAHSDVGSAPELVEVLQNTAWEWKKVATHALVKCYWCHGL